MPDPDPLALMRRFLDTQIEPPEVAETQAAG